MTTFWSNKGWRNRLLIPVAWLFRAVVWLRTKLYKVGILKVNTFTAPVIVVGNISVGGTGKTPIVSHIVNRLKDAGRKPGIVSRGYGAKPAKLPRLINIDTPVEFAGDEPSLLLRETGVPIVVCTDRSAAVNYLIEQTDIDVVVSDDGMQHYAMDRDVEIAVVDGQQFLGNGWVLPAGPLREPSSRLNAANFIAVQSSATTPVQKHHAVERLNLVSHAAKAIGHFCLEIQMVRQLGSEKTLALSEFSGQRVNAMAGLGNPQRFFASLKSAGLDIIEHRMPDHHPYVVSDLNFGNEYPVLVTSKDAVKIAQLNVDVSQVYEVTVIAKPDAQLSVHIDDMISALN